MENIISKRKTLKQFVVKKYNDVGLFGDGLFPVLLSKDDSCKLYGFIDDNGNEVIKPEYEVAYPFSEGLAVVKKDNNYFYIDKYNNKVLGDYDKAYSFKCGLAKVVVEKNMVFINKKGDIVIKSKYKTDNEFIDDMIRIYKPTKSFNFHDGKTYHNLVGYMNNKGKVIVKPKYSNLSSEFSEGLAHVKDNKNNDYFIDKNGNEKINLSKLNLNSSYNLCFKNGFVVINTPNSAYFIDKNGKNVFEKEFDSANSFSEKLAAVKVNGKWGFINDKGKMVIDAKYDAVSCFKHGYSIVSIKGNNTFIDKTGDELSDFIYSNAIILSNKYAYLYIENIILDLRKPRYEISIKLNDKEEIRIFDNSKKADEFVKVMKKYTLKKLDEKLSSEENINNYIKPLIKKAEDEIREINEKYEDDVINEINKYYRLLKK